MMLESQVDPLQPHVPAAVSASPPAGTRRPRLEAAAALLLLLVTLVAYLPALQGGWVWDDDEYVVENAALRSAGGLREIWSDPKSTPQYYPLVFTVFWIEYHLWGLNPLGYHVTNVVLHVVDALLLCVLLRRLAVGGAFLAAAIFALHPVHVESVAWVTELKNVLSGTFYLLTLLAWLRFADKPRWQNYAAALLLFAAAMLSKTVVCTLPVILLLLVWWREPSAWRLRLPRIAPFVLIGVGLGLVTVWQNIADVRHSPPLLERLLVTGRAVCFYAGKLLWPSNLMTIYPRWHIDPRVPVQYAFLLACLVVPVALWRYRDRIGKGPLVAVLFFMVSLAPSTGLLNFSFMLYADVADHFQYLPSVGLIALFAALATRATERLGTAGRRLRSAVVAAILLALGALTWQQGPVYKDRQTLWRHALEKNPRSWVTHWALGQLLQRDGDLDAAIQHFSVAAQLEPTSARLFSDWGDALKAQGKLDEAAAQYTTALSTNPKLAMAHVVLGTIRDGQGKVDEAREHLAAAVALKPEEPSLRIIFGAILTKQGRIKEAADEFAEAARLDPGSAEAHSALAAALAMQGKLDEAVQHYEAVVRLTPDDAEARQRLQSARSARDAPQQTD